jgi:hypothetical protein
VDSWPSSMHQTKLARMHACRLFSSSKIKVSNLDDFSSMVLIVRVKFPGSYFTVSPCGGPLDRNAGPLPEVAESAGTYS